MPPYAPPRPARVEHAVVYRRENEFASHPYVRGFRETAAGHLVANFSVATVDYRGDPNALSQLALLRSPGGRRAVTMRSEDRGRSWRFLSRVNAFGAPAAPLLLADGRIVMVYGNRLRPPRAWEVSPGVVGTLYCYNPRDDAVQVKPPATGAPWGAGGVRFIARSFFSVD
jgi:hypothetical protein